MNALRRLALLFSPQSVASPSSHAEHRNVGKLPDADVVEAKVIEDDADEIDFAEAIAEEEDDVLAVTRFLEEEDLVEEAELAETTGGSTPEPPATPAPPEPPSPPVFVTLMPSPVDVMAAA